MPFKYFYLITAIWIGISLSGSLMAEEIPLPLKAYFESFENQKKTEFKDHWFSPDKGYQIMGSMISTTFLGQMSLKRYNQSIERSKVIAAGTTFTLGLAKEIYDSYQPKNYFSWKDLAANGVGIILGIILLGIH